MSTLADRLDLRWRSPGPVSSQYMRSLNDVLMLNGPIGSGKTRTVFVRSLLLAAAQRPSTRDGVRKFKLCVVHSNYRQLWRSTIPSFWKLIPRNAGEWVGADNGPAKFTLRFALDDGTEVLYQVDFIAIGENSVEDVMRGYEPTAFFLNEVDLLSEDVFTYARGRVGRYPDMDEGGPSWYGILADCNAPTLTSWLYQKVFKRSPSFITLLRQPGARTDGAENTTNLPPGYYDKQIEDNDEAYIARMIDNKPGYNRAGKPVYTDFDDTRHVATHDLDPIPGIPVQIGADAGGTPAGVLGQRLADGSWRILDELTSEPGVGPIRFGERLAQLLKERYEGWRMIRGWADPSAQYGKDKQRDEKDWIELVAMTAGIRLDPSPTNNLTPRLEAVRRPLRMFPDKKPAFLMSPRCLVLRDGFNGGYHFRKLPLSGDISRWDDEPNKSDPSSHVHDALQYLMSGGGEDLEIRGRRASQGLAGGGSVKDYDWEPF